MSFQLSILMIQNDPFPFSSPALPQHFLYFSLSSFFPRPRKRRMWHLARCRAGHLRLCQLLLPLLPSKVHTWPSPSPECSGLEPRKGGSSSLTVKSQTESLASRWLRFLPCKKQKQKSETRVQKKGAEKESAGGSPGRRGSHTNHCSIGDWLCESYICPFDQPSQSYVPRILIHHRFIKVGGPLRGYLV